MCGLFGVAVSKGCISDHHRSMVESGTECLKHRGPDGDGFWSDDSVALGHRRLSILDLSEKGRQPMVSVGRRYVITYNGEIYNHRQIASDLMNVGWRPRGTSDTDVLLGAIESWGIQRTLQLVDGMFAVAIYDSAQSTLHLARDKFGEKPLHYLESSGEIWFSSELRGFEVLPHFNRMVECAQLHNYFRFGYVPGANTIYSDVHRVPPSHLITWDLQEGRRTTTQYWRLSPKRDSTNPDLLGFLQDGMRQRLISDRPVGVFLSGGIDSSLVAGLAAASSSDPIQTFNLSWSEKEYDESAQAERVARALGASHNRIQLSSDELAGAVDLLPNILDEPFGDSSLLATTLVARFARRKVAVALSGDGGDELFAGYNRHIWMTRLARLNSLPLALRRAGAYCLARSSRPLALLLNPIPTGIRPRLIEDKASKLSRALAAPDLVHAYQSVVTIDGSVGEPLELGPDVESDFRRNDVDSILRAVRLADIATYLPDDILTKVDRATMSCGLESRTPFLNADLASIALSLGPSELIDRYGGKAPLRLLLAQLIPGVSFTQPKSGFGVPVGSMLRGQMRTLMHDIISTHESRVLPNTSPWRQRMKRLESGDDSHQHQLWSLLAFEMWAADKSLQFGYFHA